MDVSKAKAKRCCSTEYDRLVRELGSCEMESNSSGERHNCYRRAAKQSGRRSRECMHAA